MKSYRYKYLIFLVLSGFHFASYSQTISAHRITDWSRAGLKDTIAGYSTVVNIMSYGGVADGVTPNDTPFMNALAALNNKPGTILFPAGSYLFHQTMNLKDSMVLQGAGTASKLLFDLGGSPINMINIQGQTDTGAWFVTQPILQNDTTIYLNSTTGLNIGDWVYLYGNDSSLITSTWAYKTVGQIFQVVNIQGNKIITDQVARRSYGSGFSGILKRILPVKRTGIECLYIERVDSTAQQTANINFNKAVNCWVIGIESNKTNFAHVAVDYSSHITIRGNYIHHSHGYGGNGQGYGIAAEYTSGDCLVENNIFEHLRHSMLIQAGANGNVFAYNYSKDPYWTEPSLPSNSAGDAVCHGNYPYMNLFEGNILQNIIVDNSHGINGPFNTFFRNRTELYGIIQNTGPATDSMNFVGNEVTNTGPLMGNYILAGNGYFEWGNNVKGTITPAGTTALPEHSLYLEAYPGYWIHGFSYPNIGTPYAYNVGGNPAKFRDTGSSLTDCSKNPIYDPTIVSKLPVSTSEITIYPNPANTVIYISSACSIQKIEMSNMVGQTVFSGLYNSKEISINITDLSPGIYFIKINNSRVQKIIKQ